MALTKQQKEQQVLEIKEKLQKANSFVLLNYTGINVAQDTLLRAKCREQGVDYKVYKNRLLKRALNELEINTCDELLTNGTAIALSYDDVVAPARVINDQAKTINVLQIKGGIVEGKFATEADIKKLANIPSRDVLIAQVLGLLQGSISSLARALALVAEQKQN